MFSRLCLCASMMRPRLIFPFFFFNDTATTEIYTLSLHDALPISSKRASTKSPTKPGAKLPTLESKDLARSEEHTSELQSRLHLVCRLLLEKKKKYNHVNPAYTPAEVPDYLTDRMLISHGPAQPMH